jgi:hypothetical protein
MQRETIYVRAHRPTIVDRFAQAVLNIGVYVHLQHKEFSMSGSYP